MRIYCVRASALLAKQAWFAVTVLLIATVILLLLATRASRAAEAGNVTSLSSALKVRAASDVRFQQKRIQSRDGVENASAVARPRALGQADLDEDGMPDLIVGYEQAGSGLIEIRRGNPHYSSYSVADSHAGADGTPDPFAVMDAMLPVAESPDFLAVGDFDNDGHADLVTAARGSSQVYFLLGNGRGGFPLVEPVTTGGAITALQVGDVNRLDGIADLIIGISMAARSEVLVFESDHGAIAATPEVFVMPATVGALALGSSDDAGFGDIVVGAANQLILIHGRDRKLSSDADRRTGIQSANTEVRTFDSGIRALTVGRFGSRGRGIVVSFENAELALIERPTRFDQFLIPDSDDQSPGRAISSWSEYFIAHAGAVKSNFPAHALIAARAGGGSESIVVSAGSHLTMLGLARQRFESTTNGQLTPTDNDSSASLAESLEMAGEVVDILPMTLNADALSDLVVLDSQGLSIVASQPESVFSVTNMNDSGPGSLRAAIVSANSNAGLDTISFNIPGTGVHTISPVSPLPQIADSVTIDGTTQPGFAGTPLIELEGSHAGETNGLFLTAGDCTIRGLAINRFFELGTNPYAGFQIWIDITSGHNRIEGNLINTNAQGTEAAPNPQDLFRSGIFVENSADNIIGGPAASARNVISGNKRYGIYLNGSGTARTIVQGNYIGVDVTGTKAIKNGFLGIYIGGTENLIGGVVAGARNVIANNSPYGIRLDGDLFDGNRIQGNYIGTDATGTVAMPNFLSGILLGAVRYTTVGGSAPLARNVISGHSQYGIDIGASGRDGFVVQGNYIGTDATGTVAIPNRTAGINLGNTKDSVLSGNVISGNSGYGIHLYGIGIPASAGTEIRNNLIGTDVTGSAPLGNSEVGVYIDGTGGASLVGNTIAFNRKGGVYVGLAWNNAIRQNSIYANGGLGIDLAKSGCSLLQGCFGTVVPNDSCDADNGGNLLQNYPVITGAASADAGTVIEGTLNSAANTRFIIDLFSNSSCNVSGNGEGKVFLGSNIVTTDGSCNASFRVLVPAHLSSGDIVTATATDPNGNTSEFSLCASVNGTTSPPAPSPTPSPTPTGTAAVFQFPNSFEEIEEGAGAAIITVVRTGSLTGTAFVDYATADGTATQRKDYIPATGTLRFDDRESRKSFVVLIVDDAYRVPGGGKSLKLTLSNPRGTVDSAALGTLATINLSIFENDSGPKPNPINGEWFFVQQQYFDFLNRQADDGGLAFWIGEITSCNSDAGCTEVKRINVSAAFFLSIEFQQTGYLVERMYKTAYGDALATSTVGGSHQILVPVVRANEFFADTQRIGRGVVVLQSGWEQLLENNKQAYALEFVQTTRFTAALPTTMTPAQFVDKLNQNAGNVLSASERTSAINLFGSAADSTNINVRAQALRQIAEDQDLYNAEFNRAFVLTEYIGYLRRNPNDAPESSLDYSGYDFWLTKLNQFNGNYIKAEMVKAFIASDEYRKRFGP